LKNDITEIFQKIEPLLVIYLNLNNYRTAINANFDQRREIFQDLCLDKEDRNIRMTNFDKMLNSTVTEIKHLNNEYKKYL
jgi:hypothetical protein